MKQIFRQSPIRQLLIFLVVLLVLLIPGLFFLQHIFPQASTSAKPLAQSIITDPLTGADLSPALDADPDPDPDASVPTPDQPLPAPTLSDLIIRALNPGYTIDGARDVGEFIELERTTDAPLSLTGYSLRYTNASGTSTTIFTFADGSVMTGETLLLRLARTAGEQTSDAVYTTTLAMSAGPLELLHHDTVVDQICWTGRDDCADEFVSSNPTSLVRSDPAADFIHLSDYTPTYDPTQPSLVLPAETDPEQPEAVITNSCAGLFFTEILSYYTDSAAEQFVELHNPTDQPVSLAGCSLAYKNKTYSLPHDTIAAQSYYAFYPSTIDLALTKNPTTSNDLELRDADGALVDTLTYLHGQKKSTSYALVYDGNGEGLWQQTYAPTPAAENIYQQFRSCPTGKVINPATGNCVKAASASTEVSDCPPGKYRNPLTNRCKTIETEATLKPCAEGYERNPETNRCRKITAENDGASFALAPTPTSDHSTFVAMGIVGLIVAVGLFYVLFQFRLELARALRKLRQRLHHIRKHLFTRGIRLHRNK